MVDLNTVKTDVQKAEGELSFVKSNWTRLSIVIILAAAVGVLIGKLLL